MLCPSHMEKVKWHRMHRWCKAEAPVQAPCHASESMLSGQDENLQHRLNRRCTGARTGAIPRQLQGREAAPIKPETRHRSNRWQSRQLTEGQRLVQKPWVTGYTGAPSPVYPVPCAEKAQGPYGLGGLYIWVLPVIWSLLELLQASNTPKNISKPSKCLLIIFLVLSTYLRVLVLG